MPLRETAVRWSDWVRLDRTLDMAPRQPGVYMARERTTGEIVYVGMAGERRESNDKPQGLRGRLAVYATGKALASGLGEAVLDRALADPTWLRQQVVDLEQVGARRAKQWGVAAFARADLDVRWTTTPDASAARALERCLIAELADSLWNRTSARRGLRREAAGMHP